MQENELSPDRPPRWIKGLLFGSLALNLAFVGLIAGAVLRHDGPEHRGAHTPGPAAFGQPYLRALPREARREMFRSLREADGFPDREERRAVYAEVIARLRSEPFDVAALAAVVSQQAEGSIAVQRAAQDAWLQIVAQMSPAERAAYAEAVSETLRQGRKER